MTVIDNTIPYGAPTPGPWRIHRLTNGWPVITSAAHDIADLRLNGNGLAHAEANAVLIATAPELLATLRGAHRLILDMGRIIRDLDDNHEWLEFWTQDGSYLCCDRRFDAVEAAIAHATAIHQPTSERN
jgi:hypothetical protein